MKHILNFITIQFRALRLRRKRYSTVFLGIGIFVMVLIAFHFWFLHHAEAVIEKIVAEQSNHKLRLRIGKLKFNWLTNKMELDDAVFYTTDTTAPVLSQLSAKRINIKAIGFLPMLIHNNILIDSIHLHAPRVSITKINKQEKRKSVNTDTAVSDDVDFSLAKEMGRISKSINEAIAVLKINSFLLDDGSFLLMDKTDPSKNPVSINKINIKLENLQLDSAITSRRGRKKILFTDEIAIQAGKQNIFFSDQRHSLAFKNFKITLKNKMVEFDSCTIRATKGDSSKTAFIIFFDKLQMTNINFDTLYQSEVIKADSVFCTNPNIYFAIDAGQKTNNKSNIQKIDHLVQLLLGDIMLNYVVVKNAGIHINTIKNGKTGSFEAKNTNFELQGFNVRQNQEHPVEVKKFQLAMHNYENILHNGRFAFAFDSVLFENDVIHLNNFSFSEVRNGEIINNFTMPKFILKGLSLESLFYDNILDSRSAQFYHPEIKYSVAKSSSKKAKNIFEILSDIDALMDLKNLNIYDGNIELDLGKEATLHLQNTDLSIMADELVASKKIKSIQHAISALLIKKGTFNKGSATITINHAQLTNSKEGIRAASVILNDEGLTAFINGVLLNAIILDSARQTIAINGLHWNEGSVTINKIPQMSKQDVIKNTIFLKNILGNNTSFTIQQGSKKISGFFSKIYLDELVREENGRLVIAGLNADGGDFKMSLPNQFLSIAGFRILNNNNGVLRNLLFKSANAFDSVSIFIPQCAVNYELGKFLNGSFELNNIELTRPVLTATFGYNKSSRQKIIYPEIKIKNAVLEKPRMNLSFANKNNLFSSVNWNGEKENTYIKLLNFHSGFQAPIAVDKIFVYLANFEYINANGKKVALEENKLNLEFENLLVQRNTNGKMEWQTNASISSPNKLYFDSLGKKYGTLQLDKGAIRNISLNSQSISNIGEVIKNSSGLNIDASNGKYSSLKNNLSWYNLNFNDNQLRADSFILMPHQSIEEYKIRKAFNQDYLAISSGAVKATDIKLAKYGQDSIINIGSFTIDSIKLLTFKDKRQEDTSGKIKPLPTQGLMKIPAKLNIDSLLLKNMYAKYWEREKKSDTMLFVPVTGLNALLQNIKNYHISPSDTLYIQSSGNVLNKLYTTLNIQESYMDSLSTFRLQLTVGPANLEHLNKDLFSLIGAKAKRGNLEKIEMEAVGNNNYSTGVMQMNYRNVRLMLMNKNSLQKQRFLNKLISWIANAFLLRKNNSGRPAQVFFERQKYKSAINFIVKTALSGAKSSLGIPGEKVKQKKYEHELKKENSRK